MQIPPIIAMIRHIIDPTIPNPQKITEIMNMQEQTNTISQNATAVAKNRMHVRHAITHIISRHAVKNAPNTHPATHSSMQSPHPTTIAKMIMMVIMRTIMLSMKRIIGTKKMPNQLINIILNT